MGEVEGRLRYLKSCIQALPFSPPAVFRSFVISLLAYFFRSSAPSLALASVSHAYNGGDNFFSVDIYKTKYFMISICFIFTWFGS